MRIKDIIEAATAGATSSGSIASIPNPHLSPGKARGLKSYTGSPGKSGTKAPPQPRPKIQKPGSNALDMKGVSIFGAPIKRVSENKKLEENISYETTIKSIIDEIHSIRQLHIDLKSMAENWFNKFGTFKNGFHRNAAGRKKIWFDKFYYAKMSRELHDLAKYVHEKGNIEAAKKIKKLLSATESSSSIIIILEIAKIAGSVLGDQRLINFSDALKKILDEYDIFFNRLQNMEEDDKEEIKKTKQPSAVGQQNAQVELIINNILQELPSSIRGDIRNAISKSPNKLQALQLELNKRGIDLNKPKSENVQWYSADDNVEQITEDLKKWFREKWVRFGPDGKIRGACARGSESEGKPKCLPQAKAHALGKKGRKYAASKKRREDPDPERKGPAKNVATRKKSNEGVTEGNINEIDHASELDSSSAAPNKLMRSGQIIGNIEGNDVVMVSRGNQTVYILKIDDQATAFVGFEGNNLKNIKNFTNTPGATRALIGYLVHKKNMRLTISPDEPLTLSGLKWVIRLINEPRGLVIKDHAGQDIDPKKLQQEWQTARKTGTPGPTGITISENIQFGRKLRANESKRDTDSLLMPFNFYSASPAQQGVAEGLPGSLSKSDYTPGKTVKHTDANCITCHGRKVMYWLDSKLFADNKPGATRVKCPTCKGTGDKQDVTEGVPQPGESSGKAKQFKPNAKIQTREMTLDQILNSVKGIQYVDNVVDDWDAKDYSWSVTKKVIEYARYLQKNPQTVANLPPLVVIDGQLNDGAHRLSAINLLQKRIEPKNPLWKQVKLKVNFGTSADVTPEQGVTEGALGSWKKKTKESKDKCPDCGGELVSEEMINEKKDACYYKVKSRYKVWPSAYASGALVQCRKKGTKNWGSKK